MPFNGAGMFVRLRNWVADATAGVRIRADYHDTEDDGFAAGLSQCVTRDGQSVIVNNIPMNGKRITGLQDPVDPQDAATRTYTDTKVADTGDTMTGDLTIRNDDPALTLDGRTGFNNNIYGDRNAKHRWLLTLGDAAAETGSNAGSNFQLNACADNGTPTFLALLGTRATGLMTVAANPTAALGICTKQYTDNADATRLPLAGGTITGSLTVNGNLSAGGYLNTSANLLYFSSTGYLQWQGGGSYWLGGGGTIWHTGNLLPILNARWVTGSTVVNGGTYGVTGGITVVTGFTYVSLQLLNPNGWYTV